MFNLTPAPTFRAPVPLSVPGSAQPLEVVFVFRHKTRSAMEKWLTRFVAGPSAECWAK